MSIKVAPNLHYVNGTSAHDKYNPIAQPVVLNKSDEGTLGRLLTNRITVLECAGYHTSGLGLQLTVKNRQSLIDNLKGKAPPLVVVSSKRAAWIQSGLVHCDAIATSLRTKKKPALAGIMDLRALTWLVNDTATDARPSPPIYCPQRLGESANRNVYILVHLDEFATYCKALAAYPTVTVVGWNFVGLPLYESVYDVRHRPKPFYSTLTGFGASRFAAIELCKMLYTLSDGATTLAWHFDDNVVAMSKKFTSLTAYEGHLKAAPCQGFSGLPVSYPRQWIREWAKQGNDPRTKPAKKPKSPIFQQAVLWNIAYLSKNNLNFGLTYVASAEDVSLSRFMTLQGASWWFDHSVAIVKETASDSQADQGAENVGKAKSQFEEIFASIESVDLPGQPAVEVEVQVGTKPTMHLRSFVREYVTKGQEGRTGLSDRAACQAAEEITKTAIGLGLVTQAAIDTFTKVQVKTVLRVASSS